MPISHRAGEFIGFSEGEYSDYSFSDLYRVLVDFDMAQATKEFIPQLKTVALLEGKSIPDHVENDDDLRRHLEDTYDCGSSAFGSYLMRLGYIEPIPYLEIHLGSYGSFHQKAVIEYANARAAELSRNTQK